MAKDNEIYLDLNKDKLLGWEYSCDSLLIGAMIEGLKLGHDFPAVDVVKRDNSYEIVYGWSRKEIFWNGGGHHRAISHYILDIPLKVNLMEDHREKVPSKRLRPLNDIVLEEGICSKQLKGSLRHLPRDIAENFCLENSLEINKYLSQ
jgi:hypothetical protein